MDVQNGIPEDMNNKWRNLLRTDRDTADSFYFQEIMPLVLERIEQNPEHRAIRDKKFKILVSLMGFSPETTVITTHVVQPEHLLIVLSGKAEESLNRAYPLLLRKLKHTRIHHVMVDPIDPTDIYDKVKHFVDTYGEDGEHIFDVTGGKKIMSATAGQVAWELNMPLCYVEGEYSPELRRPYPCTEQVELIGNPSREKRKMARAHALQLLESHNFVRAAEAFRESSCLQNDNRLEQVGAAICDTYVAWTNLDFTELGRNLITLEAALHLPNIIDLFRELEFDQAKLNQQINALRQVTENRPLARMASYLKLATIYRDMGRHDFACLFIYRCMEALVSHGLSLQANGQFDTGSPQWSLLGDEESLKKRYAALSCKIDGSGRAEANLPRKVGLVNGLTLLCLLTELNKNEPRSMEAEDYVKRIRHEAKVRNESVLAHGDRTLTRQDCDQMFDRVLELSQKILAAEDFATLGTLQIALNPAVLS